MRPTMKFAQPEEGLPPLTTVSNRPTGFLTKDRSKTLVGCLGEAARGSGEWRGVERFGAHPFPARTPPAPASTQIPRRNWYL